MSTADIAAVVVGSALFLLSGWFVLATTLHPGASKSVFTTSGIIFMTVIAGVGIFGVTIVIMSLAGIFWWLRILLSLIVGTGCGVWSRELWHELNLINYRRPPEKTESPDEPDAEA